MKVYVELDNGKKICIDVEKDSKVGDLLKKLNLENVIVMRGNEFLLEDEELFENDNIKIIKVSSGG